MVQTALRTTVRASTDSGMGPPLFPRVVSISIIVSSTVCGGAGKLTMPWLRLFILHARPDVIDSACHNWTRQYLFDNASGMLVSIIQIR